MKGTGAALRLAFVLTLSRWATALFATLAATGETFATAVLVLGGAAFVAGAERTFPVALVACFAAMLAAGILATLVKGGALRQSAAWLRGQSTGSSLEEMMEASPFSLAWFAWALPLELLSTAFTGLGLLALIVGYGRALALGAAPVAASAALALFLTLGVPLSLGWAVIRRLALAIAVQERCGPFTAAASALRHLFGRPGPFLLVLFVGLTAGGLASGALSMFSAAVSAGVTSGEIELFLAEHLGVGLLVAFTTALCELLILYGFSALLSQQPEVSRTPGWVAGATTL